VVVVVVTVLVSMHSSANCIMRCVTVASSSFQVIDTLWPDRGRRASIVSSSWLVVGVEPAVACGGGRADGQTWPAGTSVAGVEWSVVRPVRSRTPLDVGTMAGVVSAAHWDSRLSALPTGSPWTVDRGPSSACYAPRRWSGSWCMQSRVGIRARRACLFRVFGREVAAGRGEG